MNYWTAFFCVPAKQHEVKKQRKKSLLIFQERFIMCYTERERVLLFVCGASSSPPASSPGQTCWGCGSWHHWLLQTTRQNKIKCPGQTWDNIGGKFKKKKKKEHNLNEMNLSTSALLLWDDDSGYFVIIAGCHGFLLLLETYIRRLAAVNRLLCKTR